MKKRGHFISNVLLLLCIGVFVFSAWKLWGYYKNYNDGEKEYKELTQFVKEKKDSEKKQDECPVDIDFDALRNINPDVVGWIYIADSEINYPIVQTDNNEYYLHKTFEKQDNFTGAIFLDALCMEDFSSDNSIIYGHNLKNGNMFGRLKGMYDTEYSEKADYKKYEKIWVITPEEDMEYQVFAAREISVVSDTDVYTIDCASEEEYEAFLIQEKEKSMYKTQTEVKSGMPMVTLSTCTSSSEEGRFIVQAIQIQSLSH